MEAAAATGFKHCAVRTMDCALHDIGCTDIKLKHEKAAVAIDCWKDTWGWSKADVARALCHVLPGYSVPLTGLRRPADTPSVDWGSVCTLASALGAKVAATSQAQAAVVSEAAVASRASVVAALGYDTASVARGFH